MDLSLVDRQAVIACPAALFTVMSLVTDLSCRLVDRHAISFSPATLLKRRAIIGCLTALLHFVDRQAMSTCQYFLLTGRLVVPGNAALLTGGLFVSDLPPC